MKTEIIRLPEQNPETEIEKLKYLGDIIRSGGLVAFPTETVYGLGANAFDGKAVAKVFAAKNRPMDNPLIVHIADYDILPEIAAFSSETERSNFMRLGEVYWPGPLTMIVEKTSRIPLEVSCGLDTVGIRMPVNKIAAALIRASGVPIAAPSANTSGRPSPTRFEHVYEDMYGKIDAIIDGGDSFVGVESTVLDLASGVPNILRPGAITRKNVADVLGECDEYDWRANEGKVEKPKSPGMKYRHYAPRAEVICYAGDKIDVASTIAKRISEEISCGKTVGVLATDETICYYKDAQIVKSLGSSGDGMEQAHRLFDYLREFDSDGVDVIFAEALSEDGVGDAVMNRLFRAAGGRIINIAHNA